MALKIGHMSDTHNKIEQIEECLNSQKFIFKTSAENNIDAMVHSGDIWDKSFPADDDGPQNDIITLYKKYSENFPILIIRGNHDPKGSLKIFNHLNGTKIYATEEPFETVVLTINGFKNINNLNKYEIPIGVFHVITYPELNLILTYDEVKSNKNRKLVFDKIKEFLTKSHKLNIWDAPNITAFHGSIENYVKCDGQMVPGGEDIRLTPELLNTGEPDYVACGHIHKFQTFQPNYPNVCYVGSSWAVNFGEQDDKFFCIVNLDKKKFEQTKYTIPIRRRTSKKINLEKDTLKDLKKMYSSLLLNKHDFLELDIMYHKEQSAAIKDYKSIDNLKVYKILIKKKQNNIVLNKLEKCKNLDDEIAVFETYRNIKVDKETKNLLKDIYNQYKLSYDS
jgi:DNA repair exonuclease SbcCD nuclease subunit